jgi:predicted PolB exonuclease-like 3'-5' exonuclease
VRPLAAVQLSKGSFNSLACLYFCFSHSTNSPLLSVSQVTSFITTLTLMPSLVYRRKYFVYLVFQILTPQLVTFNGSSFDLPVLRYRAMVHGLAAPGLAARPYFHRYTDDAVDLCDVLSSFSSQAKATLHELCRVMGLPGKPDGMTGAEVEKYNRDGHIREIAEYCESDVLNTYRVWLRHELFSGRLPEATFQASEANLIEFVKLRGNIKPHLMV